MADWLAQLAGVVVATPVAITVQELREAAALLAWAEANRRILVGGDWRAPLVEARRTLGKHADRTLLRSRLVRGYALALTVVGAFLVALHL